MFLKHNLYYLHEIDKMLLFVHCFTLFVTKEIVNILNITANAINVVPIFNCMTRKFEFILKFSSNRATKNTSSMFHLSICRNLLLFFLFSIVMKISLIYSITGKMTVKTKMTLPKKILFAFKKHCNGLKNVYLLIIKPEYQLFMS